MKHLSIFQMIQQHKKKFHGTVFDIIGIGIFLIFFAAVFFLFPRKTETITLLLDVSKYVSIDQSDVQNWDKPASWFVERLQSAPLIKKDFFGKTDVEVLHIIYPDTLGEENTRVTLEMKVKSTFDKQTKQYYYNGSPLLIGSSQRFKFDTIMINGVVRDVITHPTLITNTAILTIRAYLEPLYYPPYAISPDDRMGAVSIDATTIDGIPLYISQKIHGGMNIKDVSGTPIAEVISVIKRPGTRSTIISGIPTTVVDEGRERVELTMKIRAKIIGNNFYFMDRYPVLIGRSLRMTFDTLPLIVTITDIQKEPGLAQ